MASMRRGLWGTVTALLAAGTVAVGLTGIGTMAAEPGEPVRLQLEEPLRTASPRSGWTLSPNRTPSAPGSRSPCG